jgi:hypothetical protein
MKKTLTPPRDPYPGHPALVDLYPALALASLVGYVVWELAAMFP